MRITGIDSIRLGVGVGQVEVVRLSAGDGCAGVGSAGPARRDADLATLLEEVAPLVIGRDVFDVEAFRMACNTEEGLVGADRRLLAGLETAMFDLAANVLGVPLHQLLGGRVRDRVRALATGWTDGLGSRAELLADARQAIAQGFDALKLQPFAVAADRRQPGLQAAIDDIAALRQDLPAAVDLVIDAQAALSADDALGFADAISSLEPLWLGDPLAGADADLARLSTACNVPIAAGSRLSLTEIQGMIGTQSADYVLADVAALGGILECRRAASWAEVFHIGLVPVIPIEPIGLALGLQLAAAIPNCTIIEVPISVLGDARPAVLSVAVADGHVEIGQAPGLGLSEIGA